MSARSRWILRKSAEGQFHKPTLWCFLKICNYYEDPVIFAQKVCVCSMVLGYFESLYDRIALSLFNRITWRCACGIVAVQTSLRWSWRPLRWWEPWWPIHRKKYLGQTSGHDWRHLMESRSGCMNQSRGKAKGISRHSYTSMEAVWRLAILVREYYVNNSFRILTKKLLLKTNIN